MTIHPTKLLLGFLTPLITAGAAWLAAAAAKYGVHLDPTGVSSVATAGATAGAAAMLKLIHDVEARHPALERDLDAVETIETNAAAADTGANANTSTGWPPAPLKAPA